MKASQVNLSLDLTFDDPRLVRYLKGETLSVDIANGWALVTLDSFSLGWGKVVNGILKNHYPKGWRRQ